MMPADNIQHDRYVKNICKGIVVGGLLLNSLSVFWLINTANATLPVAVNPLSANQIAASNQQANQINQANRGLQQSKQQINQVIQQPDFSQSIPRKIWVEKNPKDLKQPASFWDKIQQWLEKKQPSQSKDTDFGVILGMIGKTLLLLALLGFVGWLIKNRHQWLSWFQYRRHRKQPTKDTQLRPHQAVNDPPLWQGLPPTSQLVRLVNSQLEQQHWLMALSILYRGTLRELSISHDLPITKATTEQQAQQLLQLANTRQPEEAQYLTELVTIWSQMAYGNQLPPTIQLPVFSTQIQSLLGRFQLLYISKSVTNQPFGVPPQPQRGKP